MVPVCCSDPLLLLLAFFSLLVSEFIYLIFSFCIYLSPHVFMMLNPELSPPLDSVLPLTDTDCPRKDV